MEKMMMDESCTHRNIRLAYPQHWPRPEDLLHFIESLEFTAKWMRLGLDDEDDLESLQLCIMSHPEGDEVLVGARGLRIHRHLFQRATGINSITVYYGYFPDFGIVYLNCLETGRTRVKFTADELAAIDEALRDVERELERLKTIRIRKNSVRGKDGGIHNE